MIFWQTRQWVTPPRLQELREATAKNARLRYAKNAEKERERKREYRKRMGQRPRSSRSALSNREAQRKWAKENRDKKNAINALRRAWKAQSESSLSVCQREIVKTIYAFSQRITKCIGVRHEVDHIIPLSKGGGHYPSNLQVIPRSINRKKGAHKSTLTSDAHPLPLNP